VCEDKWRAATGRPLCINLTFTFAHPQRRGGQCALGGFRGLALGQRLLAQRASWRSQRVRGSARRPSEGRRPAALLAQRVPSEEALKRRLYWLTPGPSGLVPPVVSCVCYFREACPWNIVTIRDRSLDPRAETPVPSLRRHPTRPLACRARPIDRPLRARLPLRPGIEPARHLFCAASRVARGQISTRTTRFLNPNTRHGSVIRHHDSR
jgi:hypothetical protein